MSELNKTGKFTKKEYEELYPSDAIPPRMYVKAHKPEKDYPMRLVVSTIGTPPHGISAYLVKVIQHTLNKNKTRLKNSTSFVEEAKSWNISPTEVQVSYDVVNLCATKRSHDGYLGVTATRSGSMQEHKIIVVTT